MKKFFLILCLIVFLPIKVAYAEGLNCSDRYVTLVNPVRGRDFWLDKSLRPLEEQHALIKDRGFPATWLLQYDAFKDREIVEVLKKFDDNQEFGIFLEVSPSLASDSKVPYPHLAAWDDPGALFLSGYTQSQRRHLVDRLFAVFRKEFGRYPTTVGAWWIDSYSLHYLREKYKVGSAIIVADQKTTDDYGVWGQWWGVPYYPSKINILIPAQGRSSLEDVVVTQWAQRDLSLAVGEGPAFSNYSLQANDYPERGKNTDYFVSLAEKYLDCHLPIGQVTVGLETGIESVKFLQEYKNQLEALSRIKNLEAVTVGEFASAYRKVYSENPKKLILKDGESEWMLTLLGRSNEILNEYIKYNDASFADYFVADKSTFLDRNLANLEDLNTRQTNYFYLILVGLLIFWVSLKRKILNVFFSSLFFSVLAWAPVLRTQEKFGWRILFGPDVSQVILTQVLVFALTFLVFWLINLLLKKKDKSFLFYPSLAFGFDGLVSLLRFTIIQGIYYLGFSFRLGNFTAMGLDPDRGLSFGTIKLPAELTFSLTKFNFMNIYSHNVLYFLVYPLAHIVFGLFIFVALKKVSGKLKKILLLVLLVLAGVFLYGSHTSDPLFVSPVS